MRFSFIVFAVFLFACGGGSTGVDELLDADASDAGDSFQVLFNDVDLKSEDILVDVGGGTGPPSLQLPPGDESVEIVAEDGTRIFGRYLTPGGLSPYPAVLLIHQYGDNHAQWMPWAGGSLESPEIEAAPDAGSSADVAEQADISAQVEEGDTWEDSSETAEIAESDSVTSEAPEDVVSSPVPSGSDVFETLVSRGFAVLAIDLRGHGASDEYLQGLALLVDPDGAPQDVRAALSWMKGEQAIDPNRVAVMGASLGANLSYIAMAQRLAVAGVAISAREESIESLLGVSNLSGVDFASVFCLAGELDSSGSQKKTCNALMGVTEAPNPVQIVEDSADHGLTLLAKHPEVWAEVLSFLEDATAP